MPTNVERRRAALALAAALAAPLLLTRPAGAEPLGDTARGAALHEERCGLCHAVEPGEDGGRGPNVAGVVGRRAAAGDFPYSRALRASGLAWDAATLDRYLAAPAALVPGTTIANALEDAGERRDVIAFLSTLKPAAPERATPAVTPRRVPAAGDLLTGRAALTDWRADVPGLRRLLTVADLPAPFATASAGNSPRVVDRPIGARPIAPPGFTVSLFAEGLENPRQVKVAPNGDVLVAETAAGRIRLLRAAPGAERAASQEVFASGLRGPFGMAFVPAGPDPRWLYVAETNRVVRFAYSVGDAVARGAPEVVVERLSPTSGGHTTRDLALLPDGRLLASIGSSSNAGQNVPAKTPDEVRAWEASRMVGAPWGPEEERATVISFAPDGGGRRLFATGLRNCVGLAVDPAGTPWCAVNERDGLGDDLVPDYVTRVREGAFYGWPWRWLGDNEEPRLKGQRPDLAGKAVLPDALIQPHSAPLGMAFVTGIGASAFPAEHRGAYAAFHGSWNRAKRVGYKVARIALGPDGAPTGEVVDFLTGFVIDDGRVWGRPVGVVEAADGALLVTEDGNGTVWRVAWTGAP